MEHIDGTEQNGLQKDLEQEQEIIQQEIEDSELMLELQDAFWAIRDDASSRGIRTFDDRSSIIKFVNSYRHISY